MSGRVRPVLWPCGWAATSPPVEAVGPAFDFEAASDGEQSVGSAFDPRHFSILIPKNGTHPERLTVVDSEKLQLEWQPHSAGKAV